MIELVSAERGEILPANAAKSPHQANLFKINALSSLIITLPAWEYSECSRYCKDVIVAKYCFYNNYIRSGIFGIQFANRIIKTGNWDSWIASV